MQVTKRLLPSSSALTMRIHPLLQPTHPLTPLALYVFSINHTVQPTDHTTQADDCFHSKMEVNTDNFWRQLPRILLSIAKSQFVAIDLEMTGITDKNSEERLGNPTKQQIYESAKNIASTFNVFELGITCIISKPGWW